MTIASLPAERGRLRTYASFVRFEHTLFSLPLIVAGIFCVPARAMDATRWALVAIAAVGARTAAMALNRLVDRRLDQLNPRTQVRELPSGAMKLREAFALLFASIAAYLVACALLGSWYLQVSPVPLAVFALYPYLKRFTPLCHFGVGVALALAPLAGFAAAHPNLAEIAPALLLAGFALLWVSGFDIIYATLDESFDRAHRVHSMAAWLGRDRALRVSAVLHVAAFVCLIGAALAVLGVSRSHAITTGHGANETLGLLAAGAPVATACLLAIAGTLLFLEQRWAENVNLAFFKVNVWVGVVVLAIVLAARTAGGFS
jgi:4-hydroxybenzoate polyprenyltransferase